MKESYAQIREQEIAGRELPRVEIALNPLDDISWNSDGVRKQGVLMQARRGVILRIPREVTDEPFRAVYQKILATWVSAARSVSLDSRVPQQETDLTSMPLGRIDSISARDDRRGIVIGAPHGSFRLVYQRVGGGAQLPHFAACGDCSRFYAHRVRWVAYRRQSPD